MSNERLMTLTAGIAGLGSVVLVFGGQAFVQVGGGEPAFDASAAEIARFFANRDSDLYPIGSYLGVLFVVAFLWFLCGLYGVLRRLEGSPPWRSRIALASGVVFASTVSGAGWDLAATRVDDGIDPELARLAFDDGNLSFANGWVLLGSFAITAGWVMVSSGSWPSWQGWVAVLAGVGLVAARAVWATSFWFFPYAVFWLWLITISIILIRAKAPAVDEQPVQHG
jgi:hypothetical protein